MKKLFFVILLLLACGNDYAQGNHFVFLFDNSGSMQGFYREQVSAFKPFCRALIKNSLNTDDNASIMIFNKNRNMLHILKNFQLVIRKNTNDI